MVGAAVAAVVAALLPLSATAPATGATATRAAPPAVAPVASSRPAPARVQVNGGAALLDVARGQERHAVFAGATGQRVTVKLNTSSFADPCEGKVTLRTSSGAVLAGPVCAEAGAELPATSLPGAALFHVVLAAAGASGRAEVQVTGTGQLSVTPGAGPIGVAVPAGKVTTLTFPLQAGQTARVNAGSYNGSGVVATLTDGPTIVTDPVRLGRSAANFTFTAPTTRGRRVRLANHSTADRSAWVSVAATDTRQESLRTGIPLSVLVSAGGASQLLALPQSSQARLVDAVAPPLGGTPVHAALLDRDGREVQQWELSGRQVLRPNAVPAGEQAFLLLSPSSALIGSARITLTIRDLDESVEDAELDVPVSVSFATPTATRSYRVALHAGEPVWLRTSKLSLTGGRSGNTMQVRVLDINGAAMAETQVVHGDGLRWLLTPTVDGVATVELAASDGTTGSVTVLIGREKVERSEIALPGTVELDFRSGTTIHEVVLKDVEIPEFQPLHLTADQLEAGTGGDLFFVQALDAAGRQLDWCSPFGWDYVITCYHASGADRLRIMPAADNGFVGLLQLRLGLPETKDHGPLDLDGPTTVDAQLNGQVHAYAVDVADGQELTVDVTAADWVRGGGRAAINLVGPNGLRYELGWGIDSPTFLRSGPLSAGTWHLYVDTSATAGTLQLTARLVSAVTTELKRGTRSDLVLGGGARHTATFTVGHGASFALESPGLQPGPGHSGATAKVELVSPDGTVDRSYMSGGEGFRRWAPAGRKGTVTPGVWQLRVVPEGNLEATLPLRLHVWKGPLQAGALTSGGSVTGALPPGGRPVDITADLRAGVRYLLGVPEADWRGSRAPTLSVVEPTDGSKAGRTLTAVTAYRGKWLEFTPKHDGTHTLVLAQATAPQGSAYRLVLHEVPERARLALPASGAMRVDLPHEGSSAEVTFPAAAGGATSVVEVHNLGKEWLGNDWATHDAVEVRGYDAAGHVVTSDSCDYREEQEWWECESDADPEVTSLRLVIDPQNDVHGSFDVSVTSVLPQAVTVEGDKPRQVTWERGVDTVITVPVVAGKPSVLMFTEVERRWGADTDHYVYLDVVRADGSRDDVPVSAGRGVLLGTPSQDGVATLSLDGGFSTGSLTMAVVPAPRTTTVLPGDGKITLHLGMFERSRVQSLILPPGHDMRVWVRPTFEGYACLRASGSSADPWSVGADCTKLRDGGTVRLGQSYWPGSYELLLASDGAAGDVDIRVTLSRR